MTVMHCQYKMRNSLQPFLQMKILSINRISTNLLTNITLLNCETNKDTVTVVSLPPLSEKVKSVLIQI